MADHSYLIPASRRLKLLVGLITLACMAGVTTWLGGSYLGWFTRDLTVDARLPVSGDSLGVNSDVKYRGLRVGRVVSVETGTEPVAHLVLMSEHAAAIPADVRARVLPGTLFGNEYVDLVRPRRTSAAPGSLSKGDTVPADTSAASVRLMDAFTSTQRLLVALDPAALDAAVSQLAEALSGRGDNLRRFLVDADRMLGRWEALSPLLHRDVALLTEVAETLADTEPAFVRTLRDSLPVARLWAEEQQAITGVLRETARWFDTVDGFLQEQHPVLRPLLAQSAAILQVMAANSGLFSLALGAFPGVVENGAAAVQGNRIQMEGVIGLQLPRPYGPEDCPRYGKHAGRNCR
ncbi:MlaD family protein [Nocardioides daejeonensis]|uniref:MlaD family protein n=1 Tax=Nocardioides daejeonensis TaxID=1046556 RepID=UPI0013A53B4F|nr:MCE family protein [Nocardioides daejeonensis]